MPHIASSPLQHPLSLLRTCGGGMLAGTEVQQGVLIQPDISRAPIQLLSCYGQRVEVRIPVYGLGIRDLGLRMRDIDGQGPGRGAP